MKTRTIATLAATAVGALALSGGAAAALPTTIDVVSTGSSQQFVDANRDGVADRGDYQILQGTLLNVVPQFGRPQGAVVGEYTARLTLVAGSTASVNGAFRLPKALILVRGQVDLESGPPAGLPAVGWLGSPSLSRGTLSVRDLGNDESEFVFELGGYSSYGRGLGPGLTQLPGSNRLP